MRYDELKDDVHLFVLVLLFSTLKSVFGERHDTATSLLLVQLERLLVGAQDFDKMEEGRAATVAIHNDEAVAQALTYHPVEELHVGVDVLILPGPLVLVEDLRAIGGESSVCELCSNFPHLCQRMRARLVARTWLQSIEQEHLYWLFIDALHVFQLFRSQQSLLRLPLLLEHLVCPSLRLRLPFALP